MKKDDFEDYRKVLEELSNYKLPTICISIFENKLMFTTKKVGSRYFEDISVIRDNSNPYGNRRLSIDIKLESHDDSVKSLEDYDEQLVFDKYYFRVSPHTFLSKQEFFELTGITKMSDLFTDTPTKNWEYVFVIREPLKRTLTGFCEIADSYFSNLMYNSFSRQITQKYFQLVVKPSQHLSFADLPIEKVVEILNEYSSYIGSDLIRDEHTSTWCGFLVSFIQDNKLQNKISVLDLGDKSAMSIYPKIDQPTNINYLKEWMTPNNSTNVEGLIKSIDYFLVSETRAYNELLRMK